MLIRLIKLITTVLIVLPVSLTVFATKDVSTNIDDYTQAKFVSIKLPNDDMEYPVFQCYVSLVNRKTGECLLDNRTMYKVLEIASSSYRIINDQSGQFEKVIDYTPWKKKHTGEMGKNGVIYTKDTPPKSYTYSTNDTDSNIKTFIFNNRAMLDIKDILNFFEVPFEKVEYNPVDENVIIYLSESCILQQEPVEEQEKKAICVELDSRALSFDVNPIIFNYRVLVPARSIFEKMGAEVNWDDKSQTATAIKQGVKIKLTVNSKTAFVNDTSVILDVGAKEINGRIMVPIRFIAETLDMKVSWSDQRRIVYLSSMDEIKVEKAFNDY